MESSWWDSWIQTAMRKSCEAMDFMRKDLSEFGAAIKSGTGQVVEMTSSTIKENLTSESTSSTKAKLTKGLNSLLEGISKVMVIPPDDDDEIPITAAPSAVHYDKLLEKVHLVQIDPNTYLHEPSVSLEDYHSWCQGFSLEEKKGVISELLVSKADVHDFYTQFVPHMVSHVEFWQRYFYKLDHIFRDEARKESLMNRAADKTKSDDSPSWEADDWSGEDVLEDSGSDWEKLPHPSSSEHLFMDNSADTARRHVSELAGHEGTASGPTLQSVSESLCKKSRVSLTVSSASLPMEPSAGKTAVPLSLGCLAEGVTSNHGLDGHVTKECCTLTQSEAKLGDDSRHLAQAASEVACEDATGIRCFDQRIPHQSDVANSHGVSNLQPDTSGNVCVLPHTPGSISQETAHKPLSSCTMPSPATCRLVASTPLLTASAEVGAIAGQAKRADPVSVGDISCKMRMSSDLCTTSDTGKDESSPVSDTSKDIGEEWEEDLDIDLTEEDVKTAEDVIKNFSDNIELDDDWQNWES